MRVTLVIELGVQEIWDKVEFVMISSMINSSTTQSTDSWLVMSHHVKYLHDNMVELIFGCTALL